MTYGRKQGRWPLAAGGLAMLIYPYFTDSAIALVLVGVAIGIATWWLNRVAS